MNESLITSEQMQLAFISMCVEGVARRLGLPYRAVLAGMSRCDAIDNYVVDCYASLHTQPYEYIIDDVLTYMKTRGVEL